MAAVENGECRVNVTRGDEGNGGVESQNNGVLRKVGSNIKAFMVAFLKNIWEVGVEDPRRTLHAMKVGLALSLVSLVCLWDPLFTGVGVGDNAIWAVMTVVVVLEFTAGATLSKGLNRGLGTLVASSLAFLACYLSEQVPKGEAVVVGASLFIIGAAATYARFFPLIKKKFDYGVLIFLLTFSMITVTGYRVPNILLMAKQRLSTILIGCGVCLVISLFVIPIWAGEDLHNSTVNKFQGLVKSLEGCVSEYFDEHPQDNMIKDESEDPIYQGYKSVLDSKATDESLATFAGWEPRHGRFRYRHPWKQYVKVGVKLRYLAYSMVALHGCVRSEIETPHSVRSVLKKPCNKIAEEATKLLGELSWSINQMRKCDSESMVKQLKLAVTDLHAAFSAQPKLLIDARRWPIEKIVENKTRQAEDEESGKDAVRMVFRKLVSWHGERGDKKENTEIHERSMSTQSLEFAEALPLATFAWLLVEIVARLQHVVEAVDELAKLANFKPFNPSNYTPKPSLTRPAEIHVSSSFVE